MRLEDAATPAAASGAVSWGAQAWAIFAKDLQLEWRARGRMAAVLFFAGLSLLLFSFAVGPDSRLLSRLAAGFYWLALLLGSMLALGESLAAEAHDGALEGLRLLPCAPSALFVGKALANVCYLYGLALLLLPIGLALYDTSLQGSPLALLQTVLLGICALAAPGTLYATLALAVPHRSVLLPLLFLPIMTPALLASVKATTLLLLGDAMGEWAAWQMFLGIFTGCYWLLCAALYGKVIEA